MVFFFFLVVIVVVVFVSFFNKEVGHEVLRTSLCNSELSNKEEMQLKRGKFKNTNKKERKHTWRKLFPLSTRKFANQYVFHKINTR